MRRLLAAPLLTLLAALAAMPGAALAQGTPTANPFAPGIPQQTPSIPTTSTPVIPVAPTPTTGSGGGLSGGAAVAIGIGAVIVLGGISFFIWRDARKRAPVRERMRGEGELGLRSGSKPRRGSRKLSPAEKRRRKRGRAR